MSKIKGKLSFFLLLLFLMAMPERMHGKPAVHEKNSADSILTTNTFIRFVEEGEEISISEEEFFDQAGRVVFSVNDYHLPPNAPLLKQLEQDVLPVVNREGYVLSRIFVRGAASPEGKYERNKLLSEKRAQSLVDFVTSRLTMPVGEDNCSIDIDFEDYRSLCVFLSRAGDPAYEYVKSLCDKYLPKNNTKALKAALRKAQGGRLWRRLLADYFPNLRTARIIFVFRRVQPVVEQPVVETPEVVGAPKELETSARYEDLTVTKRIIETQNVPRHGQLLLRNNLLYDATLSPNLGTEIELNEKWGLGVNVGFNAWDIDKSTNKKWRHLLVSPMARYYHNFKRDTLAIAGHTHDQGSTLDYTVATRRFNYVEMNAIYSHYNVGNTKIPFGLYDAVKDRRLQGDLFALGAKYGYGWILSRDWRLEAEAGMAIGYAWFKEYDCDHCGTYYGNGDRIFLLPQLGINVVYIINL